MFKSLKLIVLLLAMLSGLNIFADELHPGHPPRNTVVEGMVHYGPTLQCEIWNDHRRPIRVINYRYDIWFRGPDGRPRLTTRSFDCRYNCRIGVNQHNVFSGPLNNGPTISASCRALVRRGN
jgi:hypothetical protein